jgi:hypothetical protein
MRARNGGLLGRLGYRVVDGLGAGEGQVQRTGMGTGGRDGGRRGLSPQGLESGVHRWWCAVMAWERVGARCNALVWRTGRRD